MLEALEGKWETLRLYPDPDCRELIAAIAEVNGLKAEQLIAGNGSDELLAFIFQALCPKGAAFADISYGFYGLAQLYGVSAKIVPLRGDFTICLDDYRGLEETIFIANPNAPTGIALDPRDIAALAKEKPDRLVVVDEAYVDFGAKSCIRYINELSNLLVVHTFSKSRNLAGGRVAFAAGDRELIADLNRIKFSFNPYNINRISQIAGAASVLDRQYFSDCCSKIIATREKSARELRLGFEMTESRQTSSCKAPEAQRRGFVPETARAAYCAAFWRREDRRLRQNHRGQRHGDGRAYRRARRDFKGGHLRCGRKL